MKGQIEKDDLVLTDILSCAKSLFAKHGLKKTTMEDIAVAAGKGKSTLYYYFPSKSEIFEAVIEEEMKNMVKRLRLAINDATSGRDKLKAFGSTHICSIIEFINLDRILRNEIIDSMRALHKIRVSFEKIQIKMINEIIEGGIQSGEFHEIPEDDIRKFAFLTVTAFRGLQFPLSVEIEELHSEQYFNAMVDMLIDGIGKK